MRHQRGQQRRKDFSPGSSCISPRRVFFSSSPPPSSPPTTSILVECPSSRALDGDNVKRSSSARLLRASPGPLNSSFLQSSEFASSILSSATTPAETSKQLCSADAISSSEKRPQSTLCHQLSNVISHAKYTSFAVTPLQGILKRSSESEPSTARKSRNRHVHFDEKINLVSSKRCDIELHDDSLDKQSSGLDIRNSERSPCLSLPVTTLRCSSAWGEDSQWFNEQFGLETPQVSRRKKDTAATISCSSSSGSDDNGRMGKKRHNEGPKQMAAAINPLKESDLMLSAHPLGTCTRISHSCALLSTLEEQSSMGGGLLSLQNAIVPSNEGRVRSGTVKRVESGRANVDASVDRGIESAVAASPFALRLSPRRRPGTPRLHSSALPIRSNLGMFSQPSSLQK